MKLIFKSFKFTLHRGAILGHDNVVRTFLEAGIDVNIRNGAGTKWTALINAAAWDKISCLRILLDGGADPDIKDEMNSRTALMLLPDTIIPTLWASCWPGRQMI